MYFIFLSLYYSEITSIFSILIASRHRNLFNLTRTSVNTKSYRFDRPSLLSRYGRLCRSRRLNAINMYPGRNTLLPLESSDSSGLIPETRLIQTAAGEMAQSINANAIRSRNVHVSSSPSSSVYRSIFRIPAKNRSRFRFSTAPYYSSSSYSRDFGIGVSVS